MEGRTRTSVILLIVALHSVTSALEARKVLNIPEKIIGGVIDIVQNHKNKPTQQTTVQTQAQQQVYPAYPQQYAPWNTGYQTGQSQGQYQGQYGNYGYPQTGNSYPQGSYVNPQGYPSGQQYGSSQAQGQGQYQTYPQNTQTGNQFQVQNQHNSASFEAQQASQFQNQVQTGAGQTQAQIQVQNQNQQFQNHNHQSGQFVNQNQNTNTNFQGSQHVVSQQNHQNQPSVVPSGSFVAHPQPTGTYGGHQQSNNFASNQPSNNFASTQPSNTFVSSQPSHQFVSNQQSGNFVGQTQPTHNYVVGQNPPQSSVTQSGFVGQHHQTSQFQGQPASVVPGGSNSGGFQVSTGHNPGGPGPTCVCQAWTKPQNGVLNDNPLQRNEEKVEKPE